MENSLITVNAADHKLDQKQAESMTSGLIPVLSEREAYIQMYTEIITKEINPETIAEAKELKKKIQKNRTQGIEAWHKSNKEVFLRGGQFVDAIKRREVETNATMEAKLDEIVNYYENIEREKREAVAKERAAKLIEAEMPNIEALDLVNMEDVVFDSVLKGALASQQERIEQNRLAKIEQERKEKVEKLNKDRFNLVRELISFVGADSDVNLQELGEMEGDAFNDFLLSLQNAKEADRLEKIRIAEEQAKEKEKRSERLKLVLPLTSALEQSIDSVIDLSEEDFTKTIEAASIKMAEIEKQKEAERQAKIEAEKKAEAERLELEKKAREEEEKRKALQAELDAKENAEREAKEREAAKLEEEANKGDAQKIEDLKAGIIALGKMEFKSKKNQQMFERVKNALRAAYAEI